MLGNWIRRSDKTSEWCSTSVCFTAVCMAASLYLSPLAAAQTVNAQELARAEARLVEILAQIERKEINAAFRAVSQLTAEVPEFRAAQLLYADLLQMRTGGTPQGEALAQSQTTPRRSGQGIADQSIAPAEFFAGLKSELQRRRLAALDMPPAGMIPSNFVNLSASVRHVIAVDTSKSRLYVFAHTPQGMQLINHFYTTIGRNGVHKRVEGDQRTPLGVYFVGRQIPGDKLPELYGKGALTVNYPNDWDRQQGRTGSGIWLHGVPSDQFARVPQASDGCVVLSNPDIDFLMQSIDRRTPVLIAEKLDWVTPVWNTPSSASDDFASHLSTWAQAWRSNDRAQLQGMYAEKLATPEALEHKRRLLSARGTLNHVNVQDTSVFHWKEDAGEIRIVNVHLTTPKGDTPTVRQYWQRQGGQWQIFSEDLLS